uniref:Putative homeodomain-like protein n=1 Tax=Helianthus annuus TaxID=4232 RepID=A0A251U0Q7_HELAN
MRTVGIKGLTLYHLKSHLQLNVNICWESSFVKSELRILKTILCFELRCLGETAIELGRILDHGLSSAQQRSPSQANVRCNLIHCHRQSQS